MILLFITSRYLKSLNEAFDPWLRWIMEELRPSLYRALPSLTSEFVIMIAFVIMILALLVAVIFKIDRIDDKTIEILDRIEGTTIKQKAIEFAVAIVAYNPVDHKSFVIGHGLLLQGVETNEYAIVTAAHVIVDVLSYKDHRRIRIESIIKSVRIDDQKEIRLDNIIFKTFIGDDYCEKGERDVGVLIVKSDGNLPDYCSLKNLKLSQDFDLGSEVFGRSRDFHFRGTSFTIEKQTRVGLGIPSRGGCSGTPFFSSDGFLLSVLHGEWKHRGSRQSGVTEMEDLSNHVYVDLVNNLDGLHFWSDTYDPCLKALEELSEKEGRCPKLKLAKPDLTSEPSEPPQFPFDEGIQTSTDRNELPYDTPSAGALNFYEEAKKKLPPNCEALTSDGYFVIYDICTELTKHRRQNTILDPTTPRLEDCLVSVGAHEYMAVSFS